MSAQSDEYKQKRLEENQKLEADRILYSGALYEDVRAAVHEIVRCMRYPNVGKNTTMKKVDRLMTLPAVIRLFDPFFKVDGLDWAGCDSCACSNECCENHDHK